MIKSLKSKTTEETKKELGFVNEKGLKLAARYHQLRKQAREVSKVEAIQYIADTWGLEYLQDKVMLYALLNVILLEEDYEHDAVCLIAALDCSISISTALVTQYCSLKN